MNALDQDRTGRTGRWLAAIGLVPMVRTTIASLALCSLLLAASLFLWQILKAVGDLAGASVFLATSAVVLGIWIAHWCGLILLNSLSLARAASDGPGTGSQNR